MYETIYEIGIDLQKALQTIEATPRFLEACLLTNHENDSIAHCKTLISSYNALTIISNTANSISSRYLFQTTTIIS